MKIFFKIIIGIMIVSIFVSLFVYIFYSDLFKSWEKDISDDVNDDTLKTDTNIPGDSTDIPGDSTDIPGDSADIPNDSTNSDADNTLVKLYQLSGNYSLKNDVDFSCLNQEKYRIDDATVYFESGNTVTTFYEKDVASASFFEFTSDGMYYDDGTLNCCVYDPVTGVGSGLYANEVLDFISFDAPFDTDVVLYSFFDEVDVYKLMPGAYQLKSDADFSVFEDNFIGTYCFYDNLSFYLTDGTVFPREENFDDDQNLFFEFDESGFDLRNYSDISFQVDPVTYLVGGGSDYYGNKFHYLTVDVPIKVDDFFYAWFNENFYAYDPPALPEVKSLLGMYKLKSDIEFDTLAETQTIRFDKISFYFDDGTVLRIDSDDCDYYVGCGVHERGMYYIIDSQSGWLFDVDSGEASGRYEGKKLEYISFDSAFLPTWFFYDWFMDNFVAV